MLRNGFIDAFWLKVIMAVLMLMDHLYYFLPGFPLWFHAVSRVVFPVFTFLIAQGMVYTRNRVAYLARLYIVGSIMLLMSLLCSSYFGAAPPNSIIMSFAITASIIYCVDRAVEQKKGPRIPWILLAICLFFASAFFEGGPMTPILGAIFYYLRKDKLQMCAIYAVATTVLMWTQGLFYDVQMLMLFAVVPIYFYNGKRGMSNAFSKYFFYVFYPVHIWVLFLIQQVFLT